MKCRIVTVAGAAVAACASLLVLSSGIAGADDPDVLGMSYGTAKGLISQANMKPVVKSVVGDRLPQNQCYVVGVSKVTVRDSSGQASSQPVLRVALSCYKADGKGEQPGFSAGNFGPSAEAVRAQDEAAAKKWKQTNPEGIEYCKTRGEKHPDWAPDPDCLRGE
jgi:hypothetical protein